MSTTGKLWAVQVVPDEVVELDQAYFPRPWSRAQWSELKFDRNYLYLYQAEGETLGFALLSGDPADDTVHLYKILLRPTVRGTGASEKFWKNMVQDLKLKGFSKLYLEVEAPNTRAIRFYEKTGARLLRTVKGYYSNGFDGLMMELTL
jgi:ribosomal-protein-alanine N-acetyltransferase